MSVSQVCSNFMYITTIKLISRIETIISLFSLFYIFHKYPLFLTYFYEFFTINSLKIDLNIHLKDDTWLCKAKYIIKNSEKVSPSFAFILRT